MLARVAAPFLLALVLVGCGGSGDPPESTPAGREDAASAKQIKRNAANAATTLTIASKDFTEEFILGEIYAQALAAGGYKVRKRLEHRLGEGRLRGGQVGQDRRLPGVHRHGADHVLRRPDRQDPQGRAAGLRPGEGELREAARDRAAAHPLHRLQRRRHDPGARAGAGHRDDLRPQVEGVAADAVGLQGVPHARWTASSGSSRPTASSSSASCRPSSRTAIRC